MTHEDTVAFDQVLAEEYRVLRDTPAPSDTDRPLAALCISGGGIRSATFALGAIQGLAEKGVMADFDYLSTVSGGGYIGAWVTSWKERAGGIEKIIPKLSSIGARPKLGDPDPIEHLREYNNFLSPKLGFLSADTWTLVATVIRNMTLNWLVLVPLLMFALMAPRLILALGRLGETAIQFYGIDAAQVIAKLAYAIPFATGAFFATAIFNTMRYLPSMGGRDHSQGDFLKHCLLPLICSALAFMTYDSWVYSDQAADAGNSAQPAPDWLLLAWMLGSCAVGWLAYLAFCVKRMKARFRLLAGPLSLAILLTGVGTATAAWLLSEKIYAVTDWSTYTTVGPPLLILAFLAAGGLFVGLTSKVLEDDDREWLSRASAWILLFVVCWAGICGVVLLGPRLAFALHGWMQSGIAAAGGLAGWICAAGGFGSKTGPNKDSLTESPGPQAVVLDWAAKLAAPVFVVVFLVGLSIFTNWLLSVTRLVPYDWTKHEIFLLNTRAEASVALASAFLALGWVAARFININTFSLHALYRNRLIRAYLGASNDRSSANKFTGFSDADNFQMHQLTPQLKPFHVVNVTLNLVAGNRLAWQQRKAESFTITPLHCGNARLGYRPSVEYGGKHGISLGTAITISGAAASPNMGYHSSPVIGFIMTLFNARLGAWLGNPGGAGERTWRDPGPSSAVGSLVKEAFGLTNDTSKYVYLSDGGHFENLGIYEMVMRGCRYIVVFDCSCDAKFIYEDLGNALRKIRIDMGIPIEFDDSLLKPLREKRKRCAAAKIRYSVIDPARQDGHLIYVKPMMLGNESPDVSTYQASHQDFPHQGTGNQWYDESQTESYRMLGKHTICEMTSGWNGQGGLEGMFEHVCGSYIDCTSLKLNAVVGRAVS